MSPVYTKILIQFLPFVFLILIFLYLRSRLGIFSNKLKDINNSLGGQLINGEYVFTKEGRPVNFKYIPGSRYSRPELRISSSGNFAGQLVIRKKTSWDNFYKGIGLNKEIQVHDQELSDKFYFECDSPEFLNQLLSNAEVKSLILGCLNNFNIIEISANTCAIRKCPGLLKDMKKEDADTISGYLVKFIPFIPTGVIPVNPELDSFRNWGRVLVLFPSFLPMATMLMGFWAAYSFKVVEIYRSWFLSAVVGLVIWIVVSSFVYLRIRGFSISSKIFIPFFITFGICVIFIVRFGGAVLNGALDHSPAKSIETLVADKFTTQGKYGLIYKVSLQPWRSGMNHWVINVKQKDYPLIRPGLSKCRVHVKPGRFGFEWVVAQVLLLDPHQVPFISDFDKIIFSSADARNNQGVIDFKQGDLDQAVADFSKAIEMDQGYIKAYRNRSIVYFKLKEYDKSWADVHKLQELGSDADPALINALKKVTGQ